MGSIVIIGIIFAFIDQIIKYVIISQVASLESISLIPSFLTITYVENTGAAWSILDGNRVFLVIVAFFAVLAMYYFFIRGKKMDFLKICSYGILLGGIIGNLIDRLFRGYVVDFISMTFGTYAFPIFNIADIGIVIGALLSICVLYKEDKEERSDN